LPYLSYSLDTLSTRSYITVLERNIYLPVRQLCPSSEMPTSLRLGKSTSSTIFSKPIPVQARQNTDVHDRVKELSDQYGSVFSLKVGKSTIIVLNDPQAIFELIHRKGALFMDRPQDEQWDRAYRNELLSLMHSDDAYKAMRKIIQQLLTPKNLDTTFLDIQDIE
jgi:cytochrome P450